MAEYQVGIRGTSHDGTLEVIVPGSLPMSMTPVYKGDDRIALFTNPQDARNFVTFLQLSGC